MSTSEVGPGRSGLDSTLVLSTLREQGAHSSALGRSPDEIGNVIPGAREW
jgi:hypothetical protein